MSFERLVPAGPPATARELLAAVRPRERAPEDRPFVFVNMVASLDGRATLGGLSSALGSEADLEMLLELRTLADAVLIGTGTLRAESYGRLVRSEERRAHRAAGGLAPDPPAVLISRGLDVPWDVALFAAAEQRVLVYTGARGGESTAPTSTAPTNTARTNTAPREGGAGEVAPSGAACGEVPRSVTATVEVVSLAEPTPIAVLADLRARGVRALLCEGGPTLNHALLAAGLVDELFLTLAPLVTGEADAPRVVRGGGLPAPVRARPEWVLRAGGELFLRYAL